MDVPKTYRQWTFAKPLVDDQLGLEQFALRETPIPDLEVGQALVRVKLINIHSNVRFRMARGITRLGESDPSNYACAEVVASRASTFAPGDIIACQAGWQDYQVIGVDDPPAGGYGFPSELVKDLNGTTSPWTYAFRPAMARMWPPEVLMDVFGTSGMTAYFGLRECGPLMPKDAVAVAAASGSVGSIAAQLAKAAGCRVVGFAGGADRCAWVKETTGVDACIDYRADDLDAQLGEAFPDGIDVYSDGVGGRLTDAVLKLMNRNSRMLSYGGAAAFYSDRLGMSGARPSLRQNFGITDEIEAILKHKNIKSEAWIVNEFYHERLKAEDDLTRLLRSGALKPTDNVVDGLDNLPAAIVGLYKGARAGKLQVRFAA
jgi:NADPH-dependent curcumin reductase CurA